MKGMTFVCNALECDIARKSTVKKFFANFRISEHLFVLLFFLNRGIRPEFSLWTVCAKR